MSSPITLDDRGALVLFSGGQDSTTCLAWALTRFGRVETIGFDYGQRHAVEMEQRLVVRDRLRERPDWTDRLGDDHVLDLRTLGRISETSLTADVALAMSATGLPNTFVPGRNLLFLTYAAAIAYRRGLRHIVTGVCETDYSGYPDCRDDTVKALQVALNLGMEARFVLHTPLMWIDKAATWALAAELGGDDLIEIIRRDTHTCYLGDRTPHAWGPGCGRCPACALRMVGYQSWIAR
ncbi:7-cyano-7-deazaguanine synthase QueC [Methyloraptor flagellatus]|uniref:7-cyano-7-deazaguanine synthase n=1 Tax=Methyloraptor flagellatus TaxID=3162530 RepID=A0AAU7X9T9_9HYPH